MTKDTKNLPVNPKDTEQQHFPEQDARKVVRQKYTMHYTSRAPNTDKK